MKRFFSRMIVTALVFAVFLGISQLGFSQSASASAGTFRTTSDVRIRSAPSTDADIVGGANAGAEITVLVHDPAGWSRVTFDSFSGYIRSDFLRFPVGNTPPIFQTTAGVNFRTNPNTNASVISALISGTSVEVLEHDPAGWSRVRHGGSTGFIRSDFLSRSAPGTIVTAQTADEATTSIVGTRQTTGNVNLRSGPSTDFSVVITLPSGTSVEVIENQANGWSRVRHNDLTGYIRSDLLSGGGAEGATLMTIGTVNMRSGPSTNNSIIRTLSPRTTVEVIEAQANGWSRVRHNDQIGYIRSDLINATGEIDPATAPAVGIRRTLAGVNVRSGPSTNHSILFGLAANTPVEVVENQANGWSLVRHGGTTGFIRSDLLGPLGAAIELVEMNAIRNLVPRGRTLRVIDVRTGISFNVRVMSLSGHADVEPITRADTDALLRSRGGVWAWAPRPVWVSVGDRTFAASMNGMPHGSDTIRDNGISGHLCIHFHNTVTISQSYQRNLRAAVLEAYEARTR